MSDASSSDEPATSEEAAPIPNLQGNIYMTSTGGGHSRIQIGESPASLDWDQGTPPIPSAQFVLAHAPRIPQPPPPQVTDLTPGENSIPFSSPRYGDSASVDWTYAGDSGAATFSWNMGGLPTGPTGWNVVSEILGPQKGNFQIACAPEPTSWLLSFNITPSQGFIGPQLVLVYVDGEYVGAFADGTQVVIKGTVVNLDIDFRGETTTELQVVYTLQYQW